VILPVGFYILHKSTKRLTYFFKEIIGRVIIKGASCQPKKAKKKSITFENGYFVAYFNWTIQQNL
jgi:hypothetical protein